MQLDTFCESAAMKQQQLTVCKRWNKRQNDW